LKVSEFFLFSTISSSVKILCVLLCLAVQPALALDVKIKGIDNSEVEDNVSVMVSSLGVPKSSSNMDEFKQRMLEKAQKAAQVYGFYHLQADIQPPKGKDLTKTWNMHITLGPVTKIRRLSLKVTGEGEKEVGLQTLLSETQLKEESPLRHPDYQQLKNQLQSLALSLGYFDFSFERASIEVYQSLKAADVTVHVSSGKRYRFGELQFGRDTRAQYLAEELVPFKVGEPYQAGKLGLFNQRLKLTQYFRNVIVRPLVDKSQNYRVPVQVLLTHKPRDNFDVGVGVSSDEGPRLNGKWRRPWVNSKGHSVGAEVFVSAPEQYASFDYRIPIDDPVNNYASFRVGYQAQNNNDTQSDKLSVSASRQWVLEQSDWKRLAFIKYEQEQFTQGFEPQQTTRLVIPGATLSRFRTKGGIDVYWGDRQSITTELASDSLLSDINLVRITAQSKWLRSIDQHRFLFGAKLGAISTNDFGQVPSSLRYFAGGDRSVRGFAYQTLAPSEVDENGEARLIGGQFLAVANFEYSYPFMQSWRGAVFVDIGNASDKFAQDLATGVGLGAIWVSPFGPIRLYVARGNSDFESNWRIHFSMGPAL
jgi:translocation and assembly module TamA